MCHITFVGHETDLNDSDSVGYKPRAVQHNMHFQSNESADSRHHVHRCNAPRIVQAREWLLLLGSGGRATQSDASAHLQCRLVLRLRASLGEEGVNLICNTSRARVRGQSGAVWHSRMRVWVWMHGNHGSGDHLC